MSQLQTSHIPVRRVSFEAALADLPKHFANGDLLSSHLVATLSSVFPDGEDFFVRSVRHYRSQITDPKLTADIKAFIGQESVHGREHRVFNDRLAQLGYPTKRLENGTRKGLAALEQRESPEVCLAVTAALEHFTVCMGELMLRDDVLEEFVGDEHVRQLLLWHALEETEHKAVAFDVYRAIGGNETLRIKTMKSVTRGFIVSTTMQTLAAVVMDSETYRWGSLWRSVKRVVKAPLFSKELWRMLREYNQPGFHPNDRDSSEMIAQARRRLFDEVDGRITPKLAGTDTGGAQSEGRPLVLVAQVS